MVLQTKNTRKKKLPVGIMPKKLFRR
jgi:hypothetical protein